MDGSVEKYYPVKELWRSNALRGSNEVLDETPSEHEFLARKLFTLQISRTEPAQLPFRFSIPQK